VSGGIKCRKCGNTVYYDGYRFCPLCGVSFNEEPPEKSLEKPRRHIPFSERLHILAQGLVVSSIITAVVSVGFGFSGYFGYAACSWQFNTFTFYWGPATGFAIGTMVFLVYVIASLTDSCDCEPETQVKEKE
jgi:hypothetical protein